VLETAAFIAVASEAEPLLHLVPGGASLDPDGVAEFFVFGSTLGTRTLIRGIQNLAPGTVLTVRIGAPTIERRNHDPLAIEVDRSLTFEQHARRVGDAFSAAVARRVDRNHETIATLTGGADTRLILSAMTPAQRQRTKFVTHYTVDDGADDDRDVLVARMLAERAGLQHEVVHRPGAEERFDARGFASIRQRAVTPEELHGVWGGEYLGGAAVDVGLFPVSRVTRETVARRVERLLSPELRRMLVDPYDSLMAEHSSCRAENRDFQFWIGMFARPFLSHLYFGSAGLAVGAWMWPWAQNLRLTSPFQDADFLRALLAVPFEYVSGYRLYNEVYRQCFPEFIDVPTNSGLAMRSDSVLTMFVAGREPKLARKSLSAESNRAAFQALDHAGAIWDRGLLARDAVRGQCAHEVAERRPTWTQHIKNVYTTSLLFKARRHLPLHKMLMTWKAKQESARAASLDSTIVGAVIDFEYWCEYSGVGRVAQ